MILMSDIKLQDQPGRPRSQCFVKDQLFKGSFETQLYGAFYNSPRELQGVH